MGYREIWHDAIYCTVTVKEWYWEWFEYCDILYFCHTVNRSKGIDSYVWNDGPDGGGYWEVWHDGYIVDWFWLIYWGEIYCEYYTWYLHTMTWQNSVLVFNEYVYLPGQDQKVC